MRQLPALQTYQPNYLGFAQAMDQKQQRTKEQNYLDTTREQAATEHTEDRNYLINQREGQAEEAGYVREARAIGKALQAGNTEQANQIYKSLGGKSEAGISILGKDVSIDYEDSVFTGPASVVAELVDQVSQAPQHMKNPQTWKWFASKGGSIKLKEAKAPITKVFQEGRNKITKQWNPKKKTWEQVASGAMDKPGTGIGSANYSPSPLRKLMQERQSLLDQGYPIEHPDVKAYNNKITGVDVDAENMTGDEVNFWGENYNLTGKFPILGRGKAAAKVRMSIAKSAARLAMGADEDGVPDIPGKTPAEAALDTVSKQADTKSIQGSLNFLDKQLSSMGSFVTNLNSQVDKVRELSKDLKTYDTRLFNIPLRTLRGKILGSPLQAKYDLYLTEIEAEIGKLATGATGSVAELSQGAQEKWAKIHDKNLSVKDMLQLLEETKHAANYRIESVRAQLNRTRTRMKTRAYGAGTKPTPIGEIEALQPGDIFVGPDGKKYRKK